MLNFLYLRSKLFHQSQQIRLRQSWLYCLTLTKGSKWQITQIWESDVFRLDIAYSTSNPSFEQKHSSCWKIFKWIHKWYCTDVNVHYRHILLIYEKCHVQELLPFVRVGHNNLSAARQKGLSSCVHQKHASRDNRICNVWMSLKNRILNVTGWKFTLLWKICLIIVL